MGKTIIKQKIKNSQKDKCALTGVLLSEDLSLIDTDRRTSKMLGGIYTDENTRIVDPVAHMKRHGNFREREKQLNQLKTFIDGREQLMKLVNSFNNRMLSVKRRTDSLDKETLEFLESEQANVEIMLNLRDREIINYLKIMDLPIIQIALKIKGVGPITVAYLITYIIINKANYASSLWSYVGFHKASHKRYEKGVAGGGNKTLRTILFNTGDSMIKCRSPYRDVYDTEKQKLENSEKIVESRNTKGILIKCKWKETKPCHRHGAAKRKMLKHFLADLWFVWRTLENLPTPHLYVQEKLGHKNIVRPEERGWEY
ncbi:hypothetical protein ES704_03653 [subsurface metagenome]|jgi:hypothetical protein